MTNERRASLTKELLLEPSRRRTEHIRKAQEISGGIEDQKSQARSLSVRRQEGQMEFSTLKTFPTCSTVNYRGIAVPFHQPRESLSCTADLRVCGLKLVLLRAERI